MKNRTHGLTERETEPANLLMANCKTTKDVQARLKRLFAVTIEQMLEEEMDDHFRNRGVEDIFNACHDNLAGLCADFALQ